MSSNGEEDPGEHFSTIVGTRDELEERTLGNGTFLRTIALTHTAELKVNSAVDALTKEHANKTKIQEEVVGDGGVQGMAESITDLRIKQRWRRYK